MNVKAIASFCFRLNPCMRDCFSTLGNPALAKRKKINEEETSKRLPSRSNQDFHSEYLSEEGEKKIMKDNEDVEYIYNSVVFSGMSAIHKITIIKTIQYLLDLGFSRDVIIESNYICLYERSKIKKALEKIKENELELNKVGLVSGFTKDKTYNFSRGTHLPDKRLQLCLYYMEQPSNFVFLKYKRIKK